MAPSSSLARALALRALTQTRITATFRHQGVVVGDADLPVVRTAASGSEAQADVVALRGGLRLLLPLTFTAALAAQDTVTTSDGHTYQVVWAPATNAQDAVRVVGVKELQ
jgi:hypothetical protein